MIIVRATMPPRRICATRFWKISRLRRFSRFNSWELSFGASRKMEWSYFRGRPSHWPQRDHYRAMCTTALSSFPGVAYLLPYYLAYGLAFYLVSSFPPSTSVDSQPNTRGLLIGRKTEDETRVKFETLEFLSLL